MKRKVALAGLAGVVLTPAIVAPVAAEEAPHDQENGIDTPESGEEETPQAEDDSQEDEENDSQDDQNEETMQDETADIVQIPDSTLKAELLDLLNLSPEDEITTEVAAAFTDRIRIREAGIRDLTGIEAFTSVTEMDFRGSYIEDVTPLATLTQLDSLSLRNNNITDISALSELINLTELNLRNNVIYDITALSGMTELTELDLRSNDITTIDALQNLTKIEDLSLRENSVSDISPLANLTALTDLQLRENNIVDLTPLSTLVNLEDLNLHTNQVVNLAPLTTLENLEALNLRRNNITNLEPLSQLPGIRDLVLRDNNITDLSPIAELDLRDALELDGNSNLRDLSPIAAKYDSIEYVDFVLEKNRLAAEIDADIVTGTERESSLLETIYEANAYIPNATIRESKFRGMASGAFPFLRGTTNVYFSDVQAGNVWIPEAWKQQEGLNTWITADFHIENVGFFGNRQGPVYDLNDFDESGIAPFYYDLTRFATSMYLMNDAAKGLQLSREEIQDSVEVFANSYKQAIAQVESGAVDVDTITKTSANLTGFVADYAEDIEEEETALVLNRWTTRDADGNRIFDPNYGRTSPVTVQERQAIQSNWDDYIDSIPAEILEEKGRDYFQLKDIVRRDNAGLGSLGVDRYYVLIEGDTNATSDDIVLDVKEQLSSVLEETGITSFEEGTFATHADRTLTGMSLMHNQPDIHWGKMNASGKSFLVKERSPFKDEFDVSSFWSKQEFDDYLTDTATVLAYGHARSTEGFSGAASAVFEELTTFNDDLIRSAESYYKQTVYDHGFFQAALDNGDVSFANPSQGTPIVPGPTPQPTPEPEPEPTPELDLEQAEEETVNGIFTVDATDEESVTVEIPLSFTESTIINEIHVEAATGSYALPLDVLANYGVEGTVDIIIDKQEMTPTLTDLFEKEDVELLSAPVKFSVFVTVDGEREEVKSFGSRYVKRSIQTDVDVSEVRYATAITITEDEELQFVPNVVQAPTSVDIYRNQNSVYAVVATEKTFEDIAEHWAKEPVSKLASQFVVFGKTESEFAPNDQLTRAEAVTLLTRALGLTNVDGFEASYSDVADDAWYADAIAVASQFELVIGNPDGAFRPSDNVTREELAVMIQRAVSFLHGELAGNRTLTFADADKIGPWATEAVDLMVALEIMQGKGQGIFDPKGHTTRAEAAQVTNQFLQLLR